MNANSLSAKTYTWYQFFPLLAGLGGGVAAIGYITIWLQLPLRMDRVETYNARQDAEIVELRNDAAQRREVLAAAVATLTQINDRTKRIEDHLVNDRAR